MGCIPAKGNIFLNKIYDDKSKKKLLMFIYSNSIELLFL